MWTDTAADFAEAPAADDRHLSLEILFFGSDAGGDQRGAGTLLTADFESQLRQWKVRVWCLHHQLHLIVQKQMKREGDGRTTSER